MAEAAFEAIVAHHGPMVWNVCRSVLFDAHAAEDAFQATFLILVRKAHSIHRRETLGPWLYGVARRVAVRAKANMARKRKRERHSDAITAALTPPLELEDEIATLYQEIDRLPEKYRAVVVLCYLEGRTHAEAARVLRCPPGTISVRASRARGLLRDRLVRRGVAISTVLFGSAVATSRAPAAISAGVAEATIKAAVYLAAANAPTAGAVPAAVVQLSDGVLRTMNLTKLTIAAGGALALGLISSSVTLIATGRAPDGNPAAAASLPNQDDPAPQDRAKAIGPVQKNESVRKAREKSTNNLMMIGLAMHNFAHNQAEHRFPPAALKKDGKVLLSWRVAILPYLDQQALYAKFHLDEPWDSPHNKTLLDQMPEVYAPVIRRDDPKGSTHYQVFVGPKSLFEDELGPKARRHQRWNSQHFDGRGGGRSRPLDQAGRSRV